MTWATGKRDAGFTLLELLVVVLIMVLVVAALPLAGTRLLSRQELRATGADLASRLRSLQSAAVRTGRRTEFAVSDNELRFASSADRILFYADGSSSGGVVHLQEGTHTVEVRVSPITGRIRIVE